MQLIKGKPLLSQGYLITYQSDTLQGRERTYAILFQKLNDSLQVTEEMTLHPTALYANDFSKIAAYNPDTRHYLDKDIFSCVVGLPPAIESMEKAQKMEDTLTFQPFLLESNDSLILGDLVILAGNVNYTPNNAEYSRKKHDAGLSVPLKIYDKKKDTVYTCEPALGIEGSLMYNYPSSVEDAGLRLKLSEENLDKFFTPEDKLSYVEYTTKSGGIIEIGGRKLQLAGFDRNPVHPAYTPKEGDIAVAARLLILNDSLPEEVNPMYVIRDNQPMSIKQYHAQSGLHIRFTNIDPATETFSFRIAADIKKDEKVSLAIARGVPRSDYLILQATIFPGINLFWVGSVLMMAGLCLAAIFRITQRRK